MRHIITRMSCFIFQTEQAFKFNLGARFYKKNIITFILFAIKENKALVPCRDG